MEKNLPVIQEPQEKQVRFLDREVPLEEGMATHSIILAWQSHGQRRLAGHSPQGDKEVGHDLTIKQKDSP